MTLSVIACSPDRYQAHRDLEAKFRTDGVRSYQWSHRGDHAVVRSTEDPIDVERGRMISFTIDAIPRRVRGAKKGVRPRRVLYLDHREDRLAWLGSRLLERAGLMIDEESIKMIDLDRQIFDPKGAFFKPGVRFTGRAMVINNSLLRSAVSSGISDGKAYGYGMLIINQGDF